MTACCWLALACWLGGTGALRDVHGVSDQNHDVAFVGVSHTRGGRHDLDGLCALGNSLRANGEVHGIMYALVRRQAIKADALRLEGIHCAWNHVQTGVGDVEKALRGIMERHKRVVVLADNQIVTGSLGKVLECEERCPLAGAYTFVLHNTTDARWPSPTGQEETDYELVWSVARNGTALRPGAGLVDFDMDLLWLPWHWQSATLDGVYASWRVLALRQNPDVTVLCLLTIHVIGLIAVSPDTFRAESALLGQGGGSIETMTRMQRACHMFFWGYFTNEGYVSPVNRPELSASEAMLSFVFSLFHVNVALCYLSFAWLEETASVQYDAAFSLLIMGCAAWGAGIAIVCVRALGYMNVSSIHFWRFYFGFACISCVYPLMLKLLTSAGWFSHYSFTPAYALTITICLLPIWTGLSSLIQLDHILSATRA